MDRALWRVEAYRDFLAARRELMAQAANEFLDSLLAGSVPKKQMVPPVLEQPATPVPGSVEGDEEYRLIQECNDWITQQGLPAGEITYELADPKTGDPLAVLDLAWPNGLQEEYSQPVALLLGEEPELEALVSRAGYRCFTDGEALRSYIRHEILAMNGNGS